MGYGRLIDIYKSSTCIFSMKLKDVLSKVIKNKKNGQLNCSIKKNVLKDTGLSKDELFDMNIDFKLKKILFEE